MIVVLCCKKLPHPCDANDAELGTKSAKDLPQPVCLSEMYVLKWPVAEGWIGIGEMYWIHNITMTIYK